MSLMVYVTFIWIKILDAVEFFTTVRGHIAARYKGQKYYKNYQGKDGFVSWICHNKHVCNRRIKTMGNCLHGISDKPHSDKCVMLDLEESD